MQEGIYIKAVEQWKDVPGWEDRYMVSNTGKVWSKCTNTIRKTDFNPDGYEVIMLSRNGRMHGTFVHRLVALAFLPNPNDYPVVNHKDENRSNNHVENLEWCSYYYNATYNNAHKKRAKNLSKDVYQYNKDGQLVGIYPNTRAAAKVIGAQPGNVSTSCKYEKGTVKGYIFSYRELSEVDVLERYEHQCKLGCSEKNHPAISKKVAQYDSNLNLVATFPSANEAHRQLGYALSGITSTCRGEHKTCHGFIFKYIE